LEPAQPDMVVTSIDVNAHDVKVYFSLNNGFNSSAIRVQCRPANTTNWITLTVNGISPISFRISSGSFVARIIDWNDQTNISNSLPFVVL